MSAATFHLCDKSRPFENLLKENVSAEYHFIDSPSLPKMAPHIHPAGKSVLYWPVDIDEVVESLENTCDYILKILPLLTTPLGIGFAIAGSKTGNDALKCLGIVATVVPVLAFLCLKSEGTRREKLQRHVKRHSRLSG